MTFQLKFKENKEIEKVKLESIKKLNNFFDYNMEEKRVQIMMLDQKTANLLNAGNSGWSAGDYIFILHKKDYAKRNPSKNPKERYNALITHEITHLYFKSIAKKQIPLWLNEGMSIYLSGQNRFKEKVFRFSNFLNCFEKSSKELYKEAGFFIELLIKKYGKEKILELINNLKKISTPEELNGLFKKTYGLELNYEEANKLLK